MIKLYVKTVVVCSLAAGISLLLACIFETYGLSPFIENIFLGLFCSLLVVIITSWLQFKTEQQRINKKIYKIIDSIIINIPYWKLATSSEKTDTDKKEACINEFNSLLSKCLHLCVEQIYLGRRKNKKHVKITATIIYATTRLVYCGSANYNELIYDCIEAFVPAVKDYIMFVDKKSDKESLEDWLALYSHSES